MFKTVATGSGDVSRGSARLCVAPFNFKESRGQQIKGSMIKVSMNHGGADINKTQKINKNQTTTQVT